MPKWLLLSRILIRWTGSLVVAVIAKISSEIAVCLTWSTLRNVAAEMSMRLAIDFFRRRIAAQLLDHLPRSAKHFRLQDSYMGECRARGLSPETVAYTESRLDFGELDRARRTPMQNGIAL